MLTTTVDYIPGGAKHLDVVWSQPRSSADEAISDVKAVAEGRGAGHLVGLRVIPKVEVYSANLTGALGTTSFVAMGTIVLQDND